MFGVEWRNFKRRLDPIDMKEQARINKKLCEYIYYLQTEILQLKNELRKANKKKDNDGKGEEE